MRIGLMIPPGCPAPQVGGLAREAESLGFDFLACGEHVFFHGPALNAFVALAAAAGATERIRLRSLLGFLHVEGLISEPLGHTVPAVASWRLVGLPKALGPGQVAALLASCDQRGWPPQFRDADQAGPAR